ncbi:hypothetical protein A9Q83_08205 [Alphaproteobacteria bacterium 46_93_T64]|nr:hypothetical protein A9Q83_08205 [Alphaproteobacteria bacterium 46_93_T64]
MKPQQPSHPYWYKVAASKPKLHDHTQIVRQVVRGVLWYVIHDRLSARQYRFTPEAYRFIGLLDGERSVQHVLDCCEEQLGEGAPSEEDIIRLLSQLHGIGALTIPSEQSGADLFEQNALLKQKKIKQQLMSPLAIRIPLFDPEDVLQKLSGLGRLAFSRLGLWIWVIVVGFGLVQAGLHFDQLSENFSDRVLAAENLVVLVLVFGVIKLCHEFGHGLAVKRWHGEAHEMGIMFLVFFPIPYVDASAANTFKTKWQRIIVSAAGMYVEMFLAAIAIIIWTMLEPGIIRSAMYNAALIGSVSTFLFNINPLLRFDGYYILGDFLEIPNLGTRSQKYFLYLVQSGILQLPDSTTPETSTREKVWLAVYAVLVAFYRVFIVGVIALFVSQKFFFLGVGIAIWAIIQLFVFPMFKALRFLLFSPRLQRRRVGALARMTSVLTVIGGVLFLVPAPLSTYADGVIWVPEKAELTVQTDGFIKEVMIGDGTFVETGTPLIRLSNADLDVEKRSLLARIAALNARYKADFVVDRVDAQLTRVEIEYAAERLENIERQITGLQLKAKEKGMFALPVPEDLEGQFFKRGQLLGFIINEKNVTVRALVRQSDADLVDRRLTDVYIIMTDTMGDVLRGRIIRSIPAATDKLPSMALSTFGGGSINVQRDEETGEVKSLEKMFEMELQFIDLPPNPRVGQRVHVIFKHGYEAFGLQAIRRLRQLLLSELNV